MQDLLGIPRSPEAPTAPLRRLQAQALFAAQPTERDRRIKRLSLTPAGRRLEAQLTGTQMRRLAAVFAAQGERSEAAWRSVMRAMTRPRK